MKNRLRKIYLDHYGYLISGIVKVQMEKCDRLITVHMTPVFIHKKDLSHTMIKKAVNAGGAHCVSIDYAKIDITDIFTLSLDYSVPNRTIELDKQQCLEGQLTIY